MVNCVPMKQIVFHLSTMSIVVHQIVSFCWYSSSSCLTHSTLSSNSALAREEFYCFEKIKKGQRVTDSEAKKLTNQKKGKIHHTIECCGRCLGPVGRAPQLSAPLQSDAEHARRRRRRFSWELRKKHKTCSTDGRSERTN